MTKPPRREAAPEASPLSAGMKPGWDFSRCSSQPWSTPQARRSGRWRSLRTPTAAYQRADPGAEAPTVPSTQIWGVGRHAQQHRDTSPARRRSGCRRCWSLPVMVLGQGGGGASRNFTSARGLGALHHGTDVPVTATVREEASPGEEALDPADGEADLAAGKLSGTTPWLEHNRPYVPSIWGRKARGAVAVRRGCLAAAVTAPARASGDVLWRRRGG